MSATHPDAASGSYSPARPRERFFAIEIYGPSLVLRLGQVEVHARRRASFDPRRDRWREPGTFEVYGFGSGAMVAGPMAERARQGPPP